jgi:hypothetical protein
MVSGDARLYGAVGCIPPFGAHPGRPPALIVAPSTRRDEKCHRQPSSAESPMSCSTSGSLPGGAPA